MMEVSGSLSSARVNVPSELATAESRIPAQQLPTATPERQAETIPGVSVQISAAARELAARDRLSASPESTAETGSGAAATPADARSAAGESSEPAASSEQGANAQSAQVRQAMQLFAETAGIGINQQNESPLRTSA